MKPASSTTVVGMFEVGGLERILELAVLQLVGHWTRRIFHSERGRASKDRRGDQHHSNAVEV